MFQSMTGYASKEVQFDGFSLFIQIKSYNSKYLDLVFRLSRFLDKYEFEMRKMVAEKISRGKVEITIRMDKNEYEVSDVKVNIPLAQKYKDALKTLSKELGLLMEFDISHFLTFDGIIELGQIPSDELWNRVREEFRKVLDEFVENRASEGKAIVENLSEELAKLEKSVFRVEQFSKDSESELKEKLREKLSVLVEGRIDEMALLNEVGLLVVKHDITEEVNLLKAHISEFRKSIDERKTPIGRKLEFLLQEMLRESNTIGAKSPFYDVSVEVVKMKETIEKMREQVRNLE